jgi:hypothetical protein
MKCPVCGADNTTHSLEKLLIAVNDLGNVYLENVPVVLCESGNHIAHCVPQKKAIYDEITLTLSRLNRPLKLMENAFLLNRLHCDGAVLSDTLITADSPFSCWEKWDHHIQPPLNQQLRVLIMNKVNKQMASIALTRYHSVGEQEILCIDASKLSNEPDEVLSA